MVPPAKPRSIEFSGSIEALAVTLGMAVDDIAASIAGLIREGYLQRVSNDTWRLKPVR